MEALGGIKELLEVSKDLSSWINGEKFESLRIVCKEHEHEGIYTATVHAGSIIAKQYVKRFGLIRKFNPQEVCEVRVYGLKPISRRIYDAVEHRPTEIILKDFVLDHCRWGPDIFRALGLMMLPRTMEILTRADLSLDKKAASGVMIYESGKFSQDIQKLFSHFRQLP